MEGDVYPLAFKVGIAENRSFVGGAADLTLGSIVRAGRTDVFESLRTRSVAAIGAKLTLGRV